MARRLYISTMYGDGSRENPYRSVFDEIFSGSGIRRMQVLNQSGTRYAMTVSELDESQHLQMLADSKVRSVPRALADSEIGSLTKEQKDTVMSVLTHIDQQRAKEIFSNKALVIDVIRWINGNRTWDGLIKWDE